MPKAAILPVGRDLCVPPLSGPPGRRRGVALLRPNELEMDAKRRSATLSGSHYAYFISMTKRAVFTC